MVVAALMVLGGSALAGESVPNRMAKAEIGEWVAFALPDGYIQKHTVVKRQGEGADAEITLRVENVYDGEVVDVNYITELAGEALVTLPEPEDPAFTLSCRKTKFTLKGKEFEGLALDIQKDGKPHLVWYVSADIPVYGVGKRTGADGAVTFEMADFGKN